MQKARFNAPASNWTQRGVSLALIALAVGSVMFWAMQVVGISNWVPDLRFAPSNPQPSVAADLGLARALGGGASANPKAASVNLALVAVVNQNGQGVALIAADGQKAQAYQLGDQVQPGRYLIQLGLRSAQLGPDPKGAATEVLNIKVPQLPTDGS